MVRTRRTRFRDRPIVRPRRDERKTDAQALVPRTYCRRHDAPAFEFRGHRRVLQQAEPVDRVLRRVGHSASDARPVRRGVPVRVDPQEVGSEQSEDRQKLQLTGVAGGRQHGGQEARYATARCQLRVQVHEQAEDRLSGGHTGEC